MKLTDIRIGTKLMGGFILVLCLAAAQTLYAVYGVDELNDNSSQIADQWLPGTLQARVMYGRDSDIVVQT